MQVMEGTINSNQPTHLLSDLSQDLVEPLVYRNVSIDGNNDLASNRVTALACLLDHPTNSDAPKASWVRSFWIRRDESESPTEPTLTALQAALPTVLSRMTNLSELFCRTELQRPQIAAILRSHGSQLTKLSIDIGGRPVSIQEALPLLKHFTALRDFHLGVSGRTRNLDDVEPSEFPHLRLIKLAAEYATNELLGWLTHSAMPKLSALAIWKPHDIWRELRNLPAFMAKHGAGLRMLQFDDSQLANMSEIFDHTSSLEVFDTFDTRGHLGNLPVSVTQIVLRQFPENIGRGVQTLESLLQIVGSLPQDRKLHTIRMCSINDYLGAKPFLWREKMKVADTRRIETWKRFRYNVKKMVDLGVSLLDQQGVTLADVLGEMGAFPDVDSEEGRDDEDDV